MAGCRFSKSECHDKGFFDWRARRECSAHGLWDCLRGVAPFGTGELTLLPFVAALSRSPGLRRCARLTASSNTNNQSVVPTVKLCALRLSLGKPGYN